jgi:hypothetical protein
MNNKVNLMIAILSFVLIGGAAGYGFSKLANNDTSIEDPIENIEIEEPSSNEEDTIIRDDAPLLMTTMTHMEQNHKDDELEAIFWNHVDQIRYGMNLADEYGAKLTFESEKPFSRANVLWDHNMMQEILDLGHGAGTHCDLGGQETNLSVEDFTEMISENKALVDDLIGEDENWGCSGNGGQTDWALAMGAAGFKYINGIVGFHYLPMDESERPEGWTDTAIRKEFFHDNSPVDIEDRIYPRMLADAKDFEADEDGIIMLSPGSLGRLDNILDDERANCTGKNCTMTTDDVDEAIRQLIEISEFRDTSRVAKVDLYFPVDQWQDENEDVLRYFFEEIQKLEQDGILQWATQKEVYEIFMEWEDGTYETESISDDTSDQKKNESQANFLEDDNTYTIFSMNTHDWVFGEKSIETLNRVIDIHEQYSVPLNIHLTDPMVHLYVEEAPDLIQRLKTSEVVAIAEHLRPPSPLYTGFDHSNIIDLEEEALYNAILNYEEQRLDLTTGETLDEPGGFEYMTEVFGYPPLIVGHTTNQSYGETLSQIYEEKGALFAVTHGKESNLGDMTHGLYTRPEHAEIKVYEHARETQSGEDIFDMAFETLDTLKIDGPQFIGLKYHENNFYTTGTPWWPVYWEDEDKKVPLEPPYDLNAYEGIVTFKKMSLQEDHWELYESTVAYAAEHRNEVNPVNAYGLKEILGL